MDVFLTYRNLRTDARRVTVDAALFSAYAAELCQRLPQPDTRAFFAQLIREEER